MKLFTICLLPLLLVPIFKIVAQTPTTHARPVRGTLSGRVTNEAGEPLPATTIYIHDIKAGSIATDSGTYTTRPVSSGNYLIEVTHQGYSPVIENIRISGITHHNFVLREHIVEQEGVTVTGVSSATRLRQSPQPVSLVNRTDLLRAASNNIIDALTRKAGISSISTGPAISKPVIRGLGYNRVVTINDGIRQEGQQWGDEHGIEIDEYSVQRVEILKGPASLTYGSDAIAGVINMITNTPLEPGTTKGNILLHHNTNNNLLGFNANLAGHNKKGFNWNTYSTLRSAGDYKNKYDRRVLNSRFNERNFGGYIGINKGWGFSHLILSTVHQNFGLIEGDRDSATGYFVLNSGLPNEAIATNEQLKSRDLFIPNQSINHTKIALDNSIAAGSGRISATFGYQANKRMEFGDVYAPETPGIYFDLRTFNYNLAYHFAEARGWRTSLGLNGMVQQSTNKGEETIIPDYNLWDAGLYIYSRKTFNKVNISAGLRGDTRTITAERLVENGALKFKDFERTFGNVTGSLGLSYDASKQVTFKANLARGYRAPSIAELSSNGAHEGTNRYEYGEQNLKTETSLQFDAGFELNTPHFNLGINGYVNNMSNYIYYRKIASVLGGDSVVNEGGEDFGAFRFDQARVTLAGVEANFDVHPHPLDWLHFENTFSLVNARFANPIEGTRQLPFIPAPRVISELRADFSTVGKTLKNTYFKVEFDYTGTRKNVFYVYNTETPTAGYGLLNIGAGTEFMSKGKRLAAIFLSLNNVTDVAYQNHLSRLKYTDVNNVTGRQGIFNMGRNFNVKLNIPLDFVSK
ncbi:MAG: TonB-dependent receptor [Segetibacter sp.]|nr:TonB-dependent receptor [Segetibacter sp.]